MMTSETPTPRKKRKNWWRKLPLYFASALLLAALVAGFWPKPLLVETAPATRGPLTVSMREEGKTRVRHRYIVSTPVSGYLNRVTLLAGALLSADVTVLATIQAGASAFLDPRTRAESEARLKALEAFQMQRVTDVARARAALDLARKEFERTDKLNKQGILSRQEWDQSENRLRLLGQELRSAEFALQAARFEVAQIRATLQQVSMPESKGSTPFPILAPIDGVVLKVYEENARVVAAGTPLMEIGDPQDLEVEIEMLSNNAATLAPGATVSIEQWGGETALRGRVNRIEPGGFTKISALGVEEQRVNVYVDFVDPLPQKERLGDRFRVETRIELWRGNDVLQIPTGALFRRGNDWMVFIAAEGKARLQRIEIGHNNGVAAEVLSGLAEGDFAILYPPDNIEDGSSIAIEKNPAP